MLQMVLMKNYQQIQRFFVEFSWNENRIKLSPPQYKKNVQRPYTSNSVNTHELFACWDYCSQSLCSSVYFIFGKFIGVSRDGCFSTLYFDTKYYFFYLPLCSRRCSDLIRRIRSTQFKHIEIK